MTPATMAAMTAATTAPALDPLPVLKGFASLRRLTGTYPAGHPMITQKLKELGDLVNERLRLDRPLRIDVIRGDVYVDGVASSGENQANQQIIRELSALGIDSIHIREGVPLEELQTVAEFLWQYRDSGGESVAAQLACRWTHAGESGSGPTLQPVHSIQHMPSRSCSPSRRSRTQQPASRSTP
jgi:hypothetical protein